MALYHFCAKQVKRSAGQSVVAASAYRAGEKLYCDYYGQTFDYTHKGGVVHQEIILPENAPREYSDRATLWNAVEQVEKNKNAQLAYSFDIALQNELSMEENISLVRTFVTENFVSRGMIVDLAVHEPHKEEEEMRILIFMYWHPSDQYYRMEVLEQNSIANTNWMRREIG